MLLPSQFNDGPDVAETCLRCFPDTLMDVVDRFGALSFDPGTTQGVWTTMGQRYDGELYRMTVDVPDTDDSRHWMTTFKQELLDRFAQLQIYIVSYAIDVHRPFRDDLRASRHVDIRVVRH